METFGKNRLPEGWMWMRLGEVGLVASGGTPSTKDDDNFGGEILWLTPADLTNFKGKFISRGKRNLTRKGLDSSSARLLPEGTVLFSSRAPIGYVAIASNQISTNQGFKNLVPFEGIFNEFIFHYLKSCKQLAESYASGTTFLEISGTRFGQLPIPIPPFPEQHRIVSKIEELFTKLDAGFEAMKKTRVQLKRYRQSVLKYAFEGRLTEEWREAHKSELEPASALLERIRKERREKWEAEKKRKGKKSAKYKEPAVPDTSGLPELPEGWCWATYEQIGAWSGGGTPSTRNPSYWHGGTIPWISPKDMKSLKIHDSKDKITEIALDNSAAKLIPPGSILFVVRSGILRRTLPVALTLVDASVNQDIKSLTPHGLINADYLLLTTLAFSEDIRYSCAKDGTTVESIEVPALQIYPIPLPPLMEQGRIVAEVERRLSVADVVENTINQAIKQAKRLRQSILKKAFEGKLVPQDPSDEPASVLLERIKAEKAKCEIEKKMKKKSKKVYARRMRLMYNGK